MSKRCVRPFSRVIASFREIREARASYGFILYPPKAG